MKHISTYNVFENYNNKLSDCDKRKIWFHSIDENNLDNFKLMIEQGIDVNIEDRNGLSALLKVANWEYIDMLQVLLKHDKLDINKINYGNDMSALMIAIETKKKNSLKLLMSHPKIDFKVVDSAGYNFLDYAPLRWFSVFITDYKLQETILKNNASNILF